MKVTPTPALVACLLLVTATPVAAQRRDLAKTLAGWDANGDGYLTDREVPGRWWGGMEGRAVGYGIISRGRIPIAAYVERRTGRRRGRDRGRGGDDSPRAPGFNRDAEPSRVAGFNQSDEESAGGRRRRQGEDNSATQSKAERYSRDLFRKYDQNENGVLERAEWVKISGSPQNADANRDGVITLAELVARMAYNLDRENRKTGDSERVADQQTERVFTNDARRSWRFTPAAERLPSNLPAWFRDRDANGDGQVAMHEYSSSWSDRRAAEFSRYDRNGDGLIVPAEALGPR